MFNTEHFLYTIFNLGEHVCSGNLYANKSQEIKFVKPAIDEFICINPLKPLSTRADNNVLEFRNFLFEIDNMPLEQQYTLMTVNEIFDTVVYSGGKSYHGIISLQEPFKGNSIEYKLIWTKLAVAISNLLGQPKNIFDPACKNPSRFTRLPGYTRSNGNLQFLEFRKLGRTSRNDIRQLTGIDNLEACIKLVEPHKPISTLSFNDLHTIDQFQSACDTSLWYKITNVPFAASAGVYHDLYKMTLWAIDCTNVTKELYLQVMEEYTFPLLLAAGYPADKLHVAVDHAYRAKDREV